MNISNGRHQVKDVINIILVIYHKINYLIKTKSIILLLIKPNVTTKYRNSL